MPMNGNYMPTDPNKKLYNAGSEWQDEFGGIIDYYSTFFREYDPVIGRFNSVDPKADMTVELSIYHYSGNNPINFNDPMGDWFTDGVAGFGANRNLGGHGYAWSGENGYLFGGSNGDGPLYQLYQAIKMLIAKGNEIQSLSLTQGAYGQWSATIGFSHPTKSTESLPSKFYSFSDPEFNFEEKGASNGVIVGTKTINLGYWKEGADFVEALQTFAGLGISIAQFLGFRKGEWWFSYRQMKFYDWSFNGNGFTGGKLKHSGAIHSVVNWAGRGLGVYNSFSIMSDYQSGKIGTFTMLAEQGSNAISTFARSPFALGWTIGWEGGRWLTSHSWYRKFRANVQNFFGHPDEESRAILRTQEILDIKIPDY